MNDMKQGFLRLLQCLDPLFPVGAFTLSNGMETYVQKNLVYDKKTLSEFLNAYAYTLPYNDAGFCAKAVQGMDYKVLDDICGASKSSYEIRSGSEKLCARFMKLNNEIDDYPMLKKYADSVSKHICTGYYCIAVGLLINDTKTDINIGLEMYCYSMLSAMVNHAVKLVPLRQLDGQKCLSEAAEKIPHIVQKSINIDFTDLGMNGTGFELRSFQHEKLYSRLYIS